ncbi:putative glycerol-3-phosphate dehydrogenase [Pseudomonas sp. IT-P44]
MPVLGQQISHGGTKTSASQDRNWALFSHMQSVNPYQWRCRHYTERPSGGQPPRQLPALVERRRINPRKMPAS